MKRSSAIVLLLAVLGGRDVAWGQSNPDGQLAVAQFPQPYLMLIRDPLVHDDLKLEARQREAIRRLTDELDVDIWSMRNKPAQQAEKTLQVLIDKAETRMAAVLSREQLSRLRQIEMWTLGMQALDRESVAQQLKLTQDQQKAIQAAREATAKSLDKLRKQLGEGGSRESLESEARQLRVDEQKQVIAALTQRQQQQWAAMLGRRIDVARLGRVRFKAPQLAAGEGWINSEPLTMEKLKGKVVALHFFAFA